MLSKRGRKSVRCSCMSKENSRQRECVSHNNSCRDEWCGSRRCCDCHNDRCRDKCRNEKKDRH